MSLPALKSRQSRLAIGIIIVLLIIFAGTTLLISTVQRTYNPQAGIPEVKGPHTILQLQLMRLVPPNTASNQPSIIQITIDTQGNRATGTQFVLQYDPTVMTNVQFNPLTPAGFFPTARVLAKYIDTTNGKINFAELLPPGSSPVNGRGIIGTMSFQLTDKIDQESTAVKFGNGTAVLGTQSGVSILKQAQNVTIPKQ